MNEKQFDQALRATLSLPSPPSTLDAKVTQALGSFSHVRRVKSRIAFSLATTAAIGFGFVALPAVQAQASISGIIRALDKETRVRIVTLSVDEEGRTWPNATTTIANGDSSYVDAKGTRRHYDVGNKSYDFDSTIGRFIVRPRRPGGSIRLSDMLSGASGFSLGKRAQVETTQEDGRSVVHATILNNGLPERYVIDADATTQLPIRLHVDALERGTWRVRSKMEFDYNSKVTAIAPDLKKFPPTTEAAANAEFEAAMTRTILGQAPLRKGRIVIRALDVAQDGSVFVAFQTGSRTPRSWNGFALDLTDDLGTKYLRNIEVFAELEGPFKSRDGKIELEIFVPAKPIPPNLTRTFKIATLKGSDNSLIRKIKTLVVKPDGRQVEEEGLNYLGKPGSAPSKLLLLTQRVAGATCDTHPSWASRIDFSDFGNPVVVEITKAYSRAKAAMQERNWAEAETQLSEELRLRHEHERQGYSPMSLSGTLENLDKVHAAMRKEKP